MDNFFQISSFFIPQNKIDALLEITEEGFSYQRKQELIAQETALDGVYVLRTSLESTLMDAATTVKAYKSLSQVEEAFRCYKSIDLKVRPIYHYKGDRAERGTSELEGR
ncbi:hypothetical protein MiYa_04719 [Microcystis aeruginosa NIES-2519]|uniref:Transposase IS4-like domain-containing protein n=1 Tax=Microcystis aeruginosa NIES-2519 TaxID=2303981 RepID=A0A5A5RAV4_MICAE|nr:hypothetical protein MiYa_04719 [Microcystis aeruginosa NIES-2519]